MCMLFAAAYPERTGALVLHGAYARGLWSEDYPWAKTRAQMEQELAEIERNWGAPFDLSSASPTLTHDAFEREWFAAFLRNSASPADATALWRWSTEIDIRGILPAIQVPTLIVQTTRDRWIKVEEGRYLAKHIAGAKYLEFDCDDHVIWGEHSDRLVDGIQSFLSGLQTPRPSRHVLLAILSLEVTGPKPQRPTDDQIRAELGAAEANTIEAVGDRYLATFQGPIRAIQCAMAIRDRTRDGGRVRAAVHIGECEIRGDHPEGAAIQLTSHLIDCAEIGEIIASRTVRDLVVGSGLGLQERGSTAFKGIPGTWPYFSVSGRPT